jgi:hypothetical protein
MGLGSILDKIICIAKNWSILKCLCANNDKEYEDEHNKYSGLTIGERDGAVISPVVRSRRQFNSDSWVHECRSDCSGVSATLKAATPPCGPGSVCRSNFIARFPGLSDYLFIHGPENRNAWALSLLP